MKTKFTMPPVGRRLALALGLLRGATAASAAQDTPLAATESVILAGGCFWCVESDFDKVPGVVETVSGYAGGHTPNPTYKMVSAGGTGHLEVVRITYDPAKVSFGQLISYFWRTVNPTDAGGQFCDRGDSYRTAIFVSSPEQRKLAEDSKAGIEKLLGRPVVTPVIPLDPASFTPAEDYHQDFHNTNNLKYSFYRYRCGRDERLADLWGDAAGKWPPAPVPQS